MQYPVLLQEVNITWSFNFTINFGLLLLVCTRTVRNATIPAPSQIRQCNLSVVRRLPLVVRCEKTLSMYGSNHSASNQCLKDIGQRLGDGCLVELLYSTYNETQYYTFLAQYMTVTFPNRTTLPRLVDTFIMLCVEKNTDNLKDKDDKIHNCAEEFMSVCTKSTTIIRKVSTCFNQLYLLCGLHNDGLEELNDCVDEVEEFIEDIIEDYCDNKIIDCVRIYLPIHATGN